MDFVQRVKWLMLLLSMVTPIAFADAPTQGYFWQVSGMAYTRSFDAVSSCEKFYAANPVFVPIRESNSYPRETAYRCTYRLSAESGVTTNITITRFSGATCADGSAPNTSLPLDEQCTPPPPQCPAGTSSHQTFKTGTGPIGSPVATSPDRWTSMPTSDGTCDVVYDKIERCYGVNNAAGTGQDFYCDFSGKMTGTASSQGVPQPSSPSLDAPKQPAEAAPFNPAQGQGCPAGTVNMGTDSAGGSICGGKGTSPIAPTQTETKQPTQTTTNPDGSTTKTDVTTRTNADGSTTTTTTKTTTNADGSTTTSVSSSTSSRPGGGAGTDTSSDDKKDDFCAKHPELMICKNSEISGGCSGAEDATSCKGDAIQCGILRQARQEYCKAKADEEALKQSAQYTLGNSILGGNDPLKDSLPSPDKGERFDVDSQLDNSGWLGGGSCFPDKTINIAGWSFTIPFASVCDYLVGFRYLVMLLAAFQSLQILSRGVFGK